MKKFFKNNLIAIIVLVLFAAGTTSVAGLLKSQAVNPGENPIEGVNPDRTQVVVTGDGYSMSKKQAKEFNLEKKKEKPSELPGNSSLGFHSPSGGGGFHFSGGTSFKLPTKKTDYKPSISTSLSDNPAYTRSEPFTFWVEGKTYLKASIDSKNYVVSINGEEIKGTGSKSHLSYTVNLPDEECEIKVKVTDSLKKKSAIEVYKVPALVGGVTASADMSNLGVAPIGGSIECCKDDTIRTAIARMISDTDLNVTYDKSGSYITKISGKSINLSDDPIDQAIKDILDTSEPPVTYKTAPASKNALTKGDFTSESKWMIITEDANGNKKYNVSAKTKIEEGLTITLVFSVYKGYEFDGTW